MTGFLLVLHWPILSRPANHCPEVQRVLLNVEVVRSTLGGPVTAAPTTESGLPWTVIGRFQYGSPPSCWLRAPTYALTVRCIGPNTTPNNGHRPTCLEYWGSSTNPAYWISDNYSAVHIIDITSNYSGVIGKLGIDSGGSRTSSGAFQVDLDGTGGNEGNGTLGCGPGLDIGSNVFWLYIHDGVIDNCTKEVFTIPYISRVSGVVTVTTTSPTDLQARAVVTFDNSERG